MKITQALFLKPPQQGVHIIADGRPAIIKRTQKYLLDQGIATLVNADDAEFPWVYNLAYHLDGDETNIEPVSKIVGGTDDPVIVCLARRYWQARHDGNLKPGPVKIPTLEEAWSELEDPSVWSKDDAPYALCA